MEKMIIKEIGVSFTKSSFGNVPFVGGILNEVLFDFRGRVKQNRINHFIEELEKYIASHVKENEIDIKYITSDQFGDLFESILYRISTNHSSERVNRFRDILVNQMITPYETDFTDTFLDLVSKINEKQIELLNVYRKVHIGEISNEDKLMDRNVLDANHETTTSSFRDPDYYKLDEELYMFYVQDLVSKSLLLDDSMNRWGTRPYKVLQITSFGLEFIRFIERN